MYLLGYDIGSSSIKTALVDGQTQEVVDIVQFPEQEMEMISNQKGWAEQHPELWWQYLCQGTQKILERNDVDPADIKSIGISYQMHGLVLVDEDHQILRPAIIWCDSRAVSIGNEAFEQLGNEFCLHNYQNSPGNFTASKLKWVKENEPDIYEKIHKMMLPGDYIAMKLSGNISTTISGLSEGILWNFKEDKLATRLLDHYEIAHDLIPEVLPTFSVSGKLTAEAAMQTGLIEGTLISYRAGDQPNNALSLNVLNPGEIAATGGTSGVVYGVVDKITVDPKSRVNAFAHVNHSTQKNRIGVLLCINGAGIQYSWLRNYVAEPNRSYDDMEKMLSEVPVGSDGVVIFPFGNGAERIFENRNVEGHIQNLEFNLHTQAHLYRAALEGVAFTFVYGINIMKEMGLEVKKMRVGNDNMFRSQVFSTTVATLLDIDLEVVDTTGAVGAALASGCGSGAFESIESVMSKIKPMRQFSPAKNAEEYRKAYKFWKGNLDVLMQSKSKKQKDGSTSFAEKGQHGALPLLLEEHEKRLIELKRDLTKLNKQYDSEEIGKMISDLDKYTQLMEEEKSHFDLLADPFIGKLKSICADLSMEELKMCTYLKLKYTTREIADKLNLSYRGTETKRYRLRKKLNVSKGTSLFSFLESISIH